MLYVDATGRRLTRKAAAAIRQAIANGQTVVFPNRHQWRHFQVRHP
jgi:hypothetical protein